MRALYVQHRVRVEQAVQTVIGRGQHDLRAATADELLWLWGAARFVNALDQNLLALRGQLTNALTNWVMATGEKPADERMPLVPHTQLAIEISVTYFGQRSSRAPSDKMIDAAFDHLVRYPPFLWHSAAAIELWWQLVPHLQRRFVALGHASKARDWGGVATGDDRWFRRYNFLHYWLCANEPPTSSRLIFSDAPAKAMAADTRCDIVPTGLTTCCYQALHALPLPLPLSCRTLVPDGDHGH
jgi:hypothetical protein